MSKKFVDKLIGELLGKKGNQKWHKTLRTAYGGKPHKIKITKKDLINLYTFNLVYAMHNDLEQKDVFKHYNVKTANEEKEGSKATSEEKATAQHNLLLKVEDEILRAGEQAAINIFGNLKERIQATGTRTLKDIQKVKGDWVITHSRLSDTALKHNLAEWGWKEIKKYLKDVNTKDAKNISSKMSSGKGKQYFRERTQVLHAGKTTVGSGHIATLAERASDKNFNQNFKPSELELLKETLELSELFGPILQRWDKKPKEGKESLEEMTAIEVTIGPSALNPSGDDAYDWKQLAPKLQEAIMKMAQNDPKWSKFATEEGSKSFTQRLAEKTAENIMDGMVIAARKGGAKARKKQSFKRGKEKKRGSGKFKAMPGGKQKVKRSKGVSRKRTSKGGVRSITKRRTSGSNIGLIVLLNAKLPETVMDNMSYPSLENRTGRFAQSVRAIAMSNKGGVPNIVYKYDRDPYGVFEMGTGDRRWSTPARDPRTIIDKSIREIATGIISGRFITTRM
tara:strand:- start:43 stop:1566 length:1524 start_codon:yes stop_codon:yes gene_type:complete